MALFRTHSATIYGVEAHLIDVEVDMYPAGSARDFVTVGMPDTAVRKSRECIKSALLNSGFGYPRRTEQEELVRGIRALFALADRLQARYERAKAQVDRLTQSVLTKALRGELVTAEAELAECEGRSYETAEELLARIERTPLSVAEARARRATTRGGV